MIFMHKETGEFWELDHYGYDSILKHKGFCALIRKNNFAYIWFNTLNEMQEKFEFIGFL